MKSVVQRCLASSDRGRDWALSYLQDDGSFKGSERTVAGPYKGPQSLLICGNVLQADRALKYLAANFFVDGNFNTAADDQGESANYRNAWLCWGAQSLGAFQFSYRAADYLQSQQHSELGGISLRPRSVGGVLEWGTTAIGIVALVACGRLAAATKGAEFLARVLDLQPQLEARLCLRTTPTGELLSDPGATDYAAIHLQEPAQIYWYFGVAMAALGRLYAATSERRWLDTAEKVFRLTTISHPDVYRALTSAKVGWGAAVLYQLTGEKRFAEVASGIADYVVEEQTREGLWLRKPQYQSVAQQPFVPSLDTTLERCLWLREIARAIA
ncbi:MAG: prenyltransferase/squalene oxidase repeat-containing protein [Chloroflexota bacterium]